MDKSSSEQQFCKSTVSTFVVWKIWSHRPSATESYSRLAGRQADEIVLNLELFNIIYPSIYQMQGVRNMKKLHTRFGIFMDSLKIQQEILKDSRIH